MEDIGTENRQGGNLCWGQSSRVLGRHVTLHGAGADPEEYIGRVDGDIRRASKEPAQAEPLSVSGGRYPLGEACGAASVP